MANRYLALSRVCACVGAALTMPLLLGCPSGAVIPLNASATTTPGTVDKPVVLRASATGGTSPYSFSWAQDSGPAVTIQSSTSANAEFTPTVAGIYAFTVTVTDSGSGSTQQRDTASVELAVGDLQFFVNDTFFGGEVIKIGNPAVVQVNGTTEAGERADQVQIEARASLFDPQFTRDDLTEMQITYDLISIPSDGREQDVSIDRQFDSISNQGTGDADRVGFASTTLDSEITIQIRANPNSSYQTLSNLATLIDNFGGLVSGDYVFRATASNSRGFERSRDLTITLVTEGIEGLFGGRTGGPRTIAVKQLPAGSPGRVTNKVMTGTQSADMTVTVLPASTTTYRFYLREENPIPGLGGTSGAIAHPEFVSASVTDPVDEIGVPTDIDLTIGASGGIPTGTYTLFCESFDGLGNVFETQVLVNGATPVRFHVTNDFYAASSINAAHVGLASSVFGAPVPFQGWSSAAPANYGSLNALADVNLDGAPDIVTTAGGTVRFNTAGFVDGSASALRHPVNSGNLGGTLAAPSGAGDTTITLAAAATALAAGDVNGDDLPDVAVSYVTGGAGVVQVFFHTGDPAQPYSQAEPHSLVINGPEFTRRYQDQDGQLSQTPFGLTDATTASTNAEFGTRIAIADVNGDGEADLVITDPGYSGLRSYNATGAAGDASPIAISSFYSGAEGRVYVFNGGASGALRPGRPDIVASRITETGAVNTAAAVGAQAGTITTAEASVQYSAAFTGGELDQIGHSLAAATTFAVGSPEAVGDLVNNRPVFRLQIPDFDGAGNPYLFSNGESFAITVGGQTQTYQFFDAADPTALPNVIGVPIGTTTATRRPSDIRSALVAAAGGFNAGGSNVSAALDPVLPNTIVITATAPFTAIDFAARGGAGYTVTASAGAPMEASRVAPNGDPGAALILTVARAFTINQDGVVYRQGTVTGTTGAFGATAVRGTLNSNMGLGATLAKGNINGAGTDDDLVIGALDSGDPAGRNDGFANDAVSANDDGAVIVVLDGAGTFTATAAVGANTLNAPAGITPTSVGRHVAIGDVNGDGREDVLYSEPGFGRIFLHKGDAFSATPNITFSGVVFDNSITTAAGTFLFGDITGDTQSDWIFIDGARIFGFAAIDR